MKETLRVNGPVGRIPRIVPEPGLYVPATGDFLPAGTSINVNVGLLHHDPRIFQEPEQFLPERWIGEKGKALDHWNLAFGRGNHGCSGIA